MPRIGVVHLIRRANGIGSFQRFLESYRAHPAGLEHDLVLIFKGFASRKDVREYDPLLTALSHRRIDVTDYGYDLGAYLKAIKRLDYDCYCFLNSFSRIRADNWLAHLYRALTLPGVGIAGATGSFESFSENSRQRDAKLGELGFRGRVGFMVRHVAGAPTFTACALRLAAWILGAMGIWKFSFFFPGFPNAHIRTNAFMASHEVLARMRAGPLWIKFFNYLFESGHQSITNQIAAIGLRSVIVGHTGRVYERDEWPSSATFWQSEQQNLLVADNQTERYANADSDCRAALSRRAWGNLVVGK